MLHNVVPADQSFDSNYAGIAGDEMKMKLKLELHSTIDKNACVKASQRKATNQSLTASCSEFLDQVVAIIDN